MERLNLHLAKALSDWGGLTVIGPVGSRVFLPAEAHVVEIPVHPLWRFLVKSLTASWRQGRFGRAIIVAGSGLTVPAVKLAAWRSGGRSVAYVHGLDVTARHPIYRAIWMPALRRLDYAFANSKNTADLAARAGVARGRLAVLHPGVSLPEESASAGAEFRQQRSLGDAPMLLAVGRMTERKGLLEFVRNALPAICARFPRAVLVVIGDEAPNALTGRVRGMSQRLLAAASDLKLADNVDIVGPSDDASLAAAYFAADVHVFPVRDLPGNVEGFGMVAVEAAAHCLPTVAFAVGGVPDAVSEGQSGYLIQPGDYERFADRVCELLEAGRDTQMRQSAREVALAFEWQRFGERLISLIEKLLGGTTTDDIEYRGHAVLNLPSRDAKARKIEQLLSLAPSARPLRILEVGTGSGGIAHYFGTHPTLRCEVDAVDVEDHRQIHEGYRFTVVNGTRLPFDDAIFDVVITNHVIEHVGDEATQRLHLREVRRVLKGDGMAYLAVPNRWQVIEPHYRLAFLSWLPSPLRTPYLRFRNRGTQYDCRPLTVREIERKFRETGFDFAQHHGRALRLTYELERPQAPAYRWLFRYVPDGSFALLRSVFPTLIYTLWSNANESPDESSE